MNYINIFKKQKLIIVSSVSLSPQPLMIRVLEGSSSIALPSLFVVTHAYESIDVATLMLEVYVMQIVLSTDLNSS